MRRPPALPFDPLQKEWERPKTPVEWRRYFARGPCPYRERVADFCRWIQYFCASDLAYIDLGVMEKPSPETVIALEHAASDLDRDSELLAALWLIRGDLGERTTRWKALACMMIAFARTDKERANGCH